MESLFSALYYGNYPAGVDAKIHDPEYGPLFDAYTQRSETFTARLSDELKAQYECLTSLNEEMQLMEQAAAYEFGLAQGLLLMAEALRYIPN